MRRLIFLIGSLAALSVAPSLAETTNCNCWTPNKNQIAQFEKTSLNGLPTSPDHYTRYYVGRIGLRGRRIAAVFVTLGPGEKSSVNILSDGKLPILKADGCVTQPWRGDNVYFHCTKPGGWLPTDDQITQLEGNLILPPRTLPLSAYARYYAGVTDNSGKKVIKAEFLGAKAFSLQPGIYIASDVELPLIMDGRCAVILATYDPQNPAMTRVSCQGGL